MEVSLDWQFDTDATLQLGSWHDDSALQEHLGKVVTDWTGKPSCKTADNVHHLHVCSWPHSKEHTHKLLQAPHAFIRRRLEVATQLTTGLSDSTN